MGGGDVRVESALILFQSFLLEELWLTRGPPKGAGGI